eukprot:1153461-Pelagomonas_calceolata.AAC.4
MEQAKHPYPWPRWPGHSGALQQEGAPLEGVIVAGKGCTWLDLLPVRSRCAVWLFEQLLAALFLEQELVLEVRKGAPLEGLVEAGSGCTRLDLLEPACSKCAGWPCGAVGLRLRSTILGRETTSFSCA